MVAFQYTQRFRAKGGGSSSGAGITGSGASSGSQNGEPLMGFLAVRPNQKSFICMPDTTVTFINDRFKNKIELDEDNKPWYVFLGDRMSIIAWMQNHSYIPIRFIPAPIRGSARLPLQSQQQSQQSQQHATEASSSVVPFTVRPRRYLGETQQDAAQRAKRMHEAMLAQQATPSYSLHTIPQPQSQPQSHQQPYPSPSGDIASLGVRQSASQSLQNTPTRRASSGNLSATASPTMTRVLDFLTFGATSRSRSRARSISTSSPNMSSPELPDQRNATSSSNSSAINNSSNFLPLPPTFATSNRSNNSSGSSSGNTGLPPGMIVQQPAAFRPATVSFAIPSNGAQAMVELSEQLDTIGDAVAIEVFRLLPRGRTGYLGTLATANDDDGANEPSGLVGSSNARRDICQILIRPAIYLDQLQPNDTLRADYAPFRKLRGGRAPRSVLVVPAGTKLSRVWELLGHYRSGYTRLDDHGHIVCRITGEQANNASPGSGSGSGSRSRRNTGSNGQSRDAPMVTDDGITQYALPATRTWPLRSGSSSHTPSTPGAAAAAAAAAAATLPVFAFGATADTGGSMSSAAHSPFVTDADDSDNDHGGHDSGIDNTDSAAQQPPNYWSIFTRSRRHHRGNSGRRTPAAPQSSSAAHGGRRGMDEYFGLDDSASITSSMISTESTVSSHLPTYAAATAEATDIAVAALPQPVQHRINNGSSNGSSSTGHARRVSRRRHQHHYHPHSHHHHHHQHYVHHTRTPSTNPPSYDEIHPDGPPRQFVVRRQPSGSSAHALSAHSRPLHHHRQPSSRSIRRTGSGRSVSSSLAATRTPSIVVVAEDGSGEVQVVPAGAIAEEDPGEWISDAEHTPITPRVAIHLASPTASASAAVTAVPISVSAH